MFDTLLDFRDDNFAETDSTSSTISDSESVSGSPHDEPNVDISLTVSNFGLSRKFRMIFTVLRKTVVLLLLKSKTTRSHPPTSLRSPKRALRVHGLRFLKKLQKMQNIAK